MVEKSAGLPTGCPGGFLHPMPPVPPVPPVPLPPVPHVRVEIPIDIQAVKNDQPDTAPAWRASTRRAFEHYFERGYRVTAYLRDGNRRFYGLSAT